MKDRLQGIYGEIHERYEFVNHVLTFGLDSHWRKCAASIAAQSGGTRWIDICCGTGGMAVLLKALSQPGGRVFAADLSRPMVSHALDRRGAAGIRFLICEAGELPFPDESFDLATISFSARNLNTGREPLIRSFREIRRVLRSGGLFVNLETSQPESRLLRWMFHSYVRIFVMQVGGALSGSADGYGYLSSSILRFYSMDEMSDILREAGFAEVSSKPLLFGAAAVHAAFR